MNGLPPLISEQVSYNYRKIITKHRGLMNKKIYYLVYSSCIGDTY